MENSPLQSVRDSCLKLRQEWEKMIQNAEKVSTGNFGSLKDREIDLMAERSEVHSLNDEVSALRSSIIRLLDEEKEALMEKILTEQIRKSIDNQFMQVKQMQSCLASQLVNLRLLLEPFEDQKLDGASNKAVLLSMRNASTCQSKLQRSNYRGTIDGVCKIVGEQKPIGVFSGECKTSDAKREDVGSIQRCHIAPLDLQRFSEGPSRHVTIFNPINVKEEPQDESTRGLCVLFNEKDIVNGDNIKDMDKLDHELLSERLKVLRQNICQHMKEEKVDDLAEHGIPIGGECSARSLHESKCFDIDRRKRKRRQDSQRSSLTNKKKVTIEIALQEDAPGLLEKLKEKGLLQDMIIHCACCDDEWSDTVDHFKDLELIATKVWGTPSGFFKFPQLNRQQTNLGKAPTYCLSCLVFLMDQAKSLRQRGWPVEWVWCRQLQAFIFVFDKHNRIIVERPEYGNATYFFELVESLPVKWQVLRLIKVLNVTAFGKTSLLENRPLQVDCDLTIDESKVLEHYGWTPNTGLGSFLNFYNRVYHDVKDEDNFEWKQKLGKYLMDGYDKGRLTTQNIPALPEGLIHPELQEDIKPDVALT